MDHVEIDSFVKKFKLLWGAGYDTTLNFESKLGEMHINLSCKVGRIIPLPSTPSSANESTAKYRKPIIFPSPSASESLP